MLTPSNICKIDFEEVYGGITIPRAVIFNTTQISEDEVNALIDSGEWEEDNRLIVVRQKQLKYFQDKEN